jgi:hypothetical protein
MPSTFFTGTPVPPSCNRYSVNRMQIYASYNSTARCHNNLQNKENFDRFSIFSNVGKYRYRVLLKSMAQDLGPEFCLGRNPFIKYRYRYSCSEFSYRFRYRNLFIIFGHYRYCTLKFTGTLVELQNTGIMHKGEQIYFPISI